MDSTTRPPRTPDPRQDRINAIVKDARSHIPEERRRNHEETHGDTISGWVCYPISDVEIAYIEAIDRAEAAAPDAHDLLMKGAEIGYTYGALGRDFASVLPEIRRLARG